MNRTVPSHGSSSFVCPHCQTQAQQIWAESIWVQSEGRGGSTAWNTLDRSECYVCENETIWRRSPYNGPIVSGGLNPKETTETESEWTILWPPSTAGERAHEMLPERLDDVYEEARAVAAVSPRAAAALLRLLTEDLVQQIAVSKVSLNDNIGALVRAGRLGPEEQQMADYLRITGNRAVHPGQVEDDGGEVCRRTHLMFAFINLLVERFIALPARTAAAYAQLPEGARRAIETRDASTD